MAAGQETEVERGTAALTLPARTRGPWPRPARRRPDWTLAAPPVVTLAVMLWGIAAPSYWRDESATLSATDRSIPQLLRMLGRVDAVHGFYYLLLWPVVHFVGTREFETRLPSALAMAAAALGIAAIGRRLRSRRAGLYAGLVFAVMPLVTYQGHDARPYALETALAVLATYLLLRAAENPTAARFAAYALSLVLLGYMHLFGLLIIPAHAFALIPLAKWSRAQRGGEAPGAGGEAAGTGSAPEVDAGSAPDVDAAALWARWLAADATAGVLLAPLLWLAWRERWAIGWLPPTTGHDLSALVASLAAGTLASALVFAGLIAVGTVHADWPDRTSRPGWWRSASRRPVRTVRAAATLAPRAGHDERALTWVALPWLVLPPTILLIAAEFKPVYEFMYVEYCLPAVALLVGAGLAAIGRPVRLAASALVVILGLPAQLFLRTPLAGGYIRATAQFLAQHERPGDAVYYPSFGGGVPTWNITYPDGFARLRAIQLNKTAAQAGRLVGTALPLPVIPQRLQSVRRLWVVEESPSWVTPRLHLAPDFRPTLSWHHNQMRIRLYVRVRPAAPH
jgi:mannosyltransferase